MSETMPADLLDGGIWRRATWERRTLAERVELWPRAQKAMGIQCPKLKFGSFYYPTLGIKLRGVRATEAIRSAELVCRVPRASLLSAFTIQNSSLSPMVREVGTRSAMASFLIRESTRNASFWMPYVKALLEAHPTDGIPQTWDPATSQERLNSLSNYSRQLAASSRAATESAWRRLVDVSFRRHAAALSEGGVCDAIVCSQEQLVQVYSRERFRSMVSVLHARQWSMPWYTPGQQILFSAPGADLLNHGTPGDVKNRFRASEHAFTMHAKRAIRKGEEVRKHYSYLMCCERYLNAYGFLPSGVPQCQTPPHMPRGPNPCGRRTAAAAGAAEAPSPTARP